MSIVDETQFRQPPATYRPVAMWFLNGDLEEGELIRQVQAMAEGGVGGIQVAARTGLNVPYLSERWFELIGLITEEARRHGMDVWLADEYPYPSGASGGEVILRHPEYRAWQMKATRLVVGPGEAVRAVAPGTVLLRACAAPVVGGTARWEETVSLDQYVGLIQHEQVFFQPTSVYLTTRRYMTNGPRPTLDWRAPAGSDQWEVWLIAAAEVERYKFFGAYVDLCNAGAVRFFLESTYERYLARLGLERFRQLAGFFVDESHPPNWSWHYPDAFRSRCGYDLYEALPALWTDIGPRTAQIRYDFLQSVTELFVESFHRPLAEWCEAHGVQLSLEVDSLRNVVQRHAHVAGIDPGHHKVGWPLSQIMAHELPRYRGNLNFPASLASQVGRRRVLDELFHSIGWSLTLQDMKALLDRAAARGANLFAFHGFCYTIGGLRKWDAPPSEFDQNPYWPHFLQLASYAGRLGYAMSRGRRVAPLALVDPITSLWAHGEALGAGRDELATRVGTDWRYLMRELAGAQRPHDNLDPLMLAEAIVEGGVLRLGEAEYRAVVLPPMSTLEMAGWQKLEQFAAAGGVVVGCGLLPYEQIEPDSDVASRCAAAFGVDSDELRHDYERGEQVTGEGAQTIDHSRVAVAHSGNFVLLRTTGSLAATGAFAALERVLDKVVPLDLRLAPLIGEGGRNGDGSGSPGSDSRDSSSRDGSSYSVRRQIFLQQRRDGEEDLFLIASAGMDEYDCDVSLRAVDGRTVDVTRLDLETGEAAALQAPLDAAASVQRARLHFPPYGAHLLLVNRRPGDMPALGVPAVDLSSSGVTHQRDVVLPEGRSEAETAVTEQVVAEQVVAEVSIVEVGSTQRPVVALLLDGEWTCVPAGDNALRLDRFLFSMTTAADERGQAGSAEAGDHAYRSATAALRQPGVPVVSPKPLVNVLQDLERDGLPWPVPVEASPAFGAPPLLRPRLPSMAWYLATFDVQAGAMPASLALCLEDEALPADWALWLNGRPVAREAFQPRRRWTVSNRDADVAQLLQPGRNEVVLRVRVDQSWEGLLEPLYLLGDFGVTYQDDGHPALTGRPEGVTWKGLFGAGSVRGGYPYYAGTLHLSRTVNLSPPAGDVLVRLPDEPLMFAGVAQLAVNGQTLGTRTWAPYAWTAPAGVLRSGKNEITLSITNTLIGLLEGRRYDPQRCQAVPLRA